MHQTDLPLLAQDTPSLRTYGLASQGVNVVISTPHSASQYNVAPEPVESASAYRTSELPERSRTPGVVGHLRALGAPVWQRSRGHPNRQNAPP